MSGFQLHDLEVSKPFGDRPGPPRILLLLEREPNRDCLSEWLSPAYEILVPDDGSPDEVAFDLCIVDESMLETHHDVLQRIEERAAPVILPYLLVTTARGDHPTDPAVWELVDEIISIPTQKKTLEKRLTNLLERRELSVELATDLDRHRQLFRRIFESSNDAILVIDSKGLRIRECNPQACDLLGYGREELRSLSAGDVHPDDPSALRAFFESVLDGGRGWTDELTCRTKDGASLVAEISASVIDVDGRPHVLANVRDITTRYEQRRILNSLHDVTAELMRAPTDREIAEITVEAARRVFEYDLAGVHLLDEDTSPETLEFVAATDETYDCVSEEPAAYEVGHGCVGEAFESQEPVIIDDLRTEPSPVEYGSIRSAMCLPLGRHGVLSIGGTEPAAFDDVDLELTDILATNATAALTRAQREQSLSEQKEYVSGLFENTTDCIADVTFEDGTPCIRNINPAFERVFGYASAEVRGKPLIELVVPPEEEAASRSIARHALAGRRTETEGRRDTATGRRDFLIRVVPLQQDGQTIGAYVVYTDITEQKRRDQQLQVLNRVLRHNLRNKLNVVRGVVERSLDAEGEIPDALASNGLDAVDELLELSETVRSLSEETRPVDNPDPVRVAEVVERTVGSIEATYPDADVAVDGDVDAWVAGTVQLDRALRELCTNAIEHSDRSTPAVRITAESADDVAGWVAITVEDDGPGIPDEQRAVLREGEETQLQHGNGLGLWVVNWIVTGAGGDLTLSDGDDRGATVTLRLPAVEANRRPGRTVGDSSS